MDYVYEGFEFIRTLFLVIFGFVSGFAFIYFERRRIDIINDPDNWLTLYLKYLYFDLFESGAKDTEYREYKDYWKKRIPGKRYILLCRGYSKKRVIEAKIKQVNVIPFADLPDYAKEFYSESKYKYYYAIKCKKIR